MALLVAGTAVTAGCGADAAPSDDEPATSPTSTTATSPLASTAAATVGSIESALSAPSCGVNLVASNNAPGTVQLGKATSFKIPASIEITASTSAFGYAELDFSLNGTINRCNYTYTFGGSTTKLDLLGCGSGVAGDPISADTLTLTTAFSSTLSVRVLLGLGAVDACDDGNSCTTDSCGGGANTTSKILPCSNVNSCQAPVLKVAPVPGLSGKYIVDSADTSKPFRIHGVDRAGAHWACQPKAYFYSANADDPAHLFHGPRDQASVETMKRQKINAVRIPLNESCWLGGNYTGIDPNYSGAAHQSAVASYVNLLTKNGLAVILDLHWSGPGTDIASGQAVMADREHAINFWTSVASTFKGNLAVMFDLFNEPDMRQKLPVAGDWDCWLNGTTSSNKCVDATGAPLPYPVAGMAELYQAVRAKAGANNVVLMGGLDFSHQFGTVNADGSNASSKVGWVSSVNTILNVTNVAASYHQYDGDPFENCPGNCDTVAHAQAEIQKAINAQNIMSVVNAGFPVIVGEVGVKNDDVDAPWMEAFLLWADSHKLGYLAWNWNTVAAPSLLTDFSPKFTNAGQVYFDHLKNTTY